MSSSLKKCIGLLLVIAAIGWVAYQESSHRSRTVQFNRPVINIAAEVGHGSLSEHTYSNDYFGLTVPIPTDWYIQTREEAEELTRLGKSAILADGADPNLKASVEAAQTTSIQLLSAFRHPPGTPTLFNPSVMIMAERVRHLPGIRSGAEYCAHLKQGLKMSAIKSESDAVESGLKIGSLEAHCLPVRMNAGTTVIHQRYYATRYKDYVLALIASYSTDEEYAEIQKILAEIKAGSR